MKLDKTQPPRPRAFVAPDGATLSGDDLVDFLYLIKGNDTGRFLGDRRGRDVFLLAGNMAASSQSIKTKFSKTELRGIAWSALVSMEPHPVKENLLSGGFWKAWAKDADSVMKMVLKLRVPGMFQDAQRRLCARIEANDTTVKKARERAQKIIRPSLLSMDTAKLVNGQK